MYWIAHRGNVYGRQPQRENTPAYIEEAIALGYDVEIDVWWVNDAFYLGHDEPALMIDPAFLLQHKEKLWCHAKNAAALSRLLTYFPDIHVFSHDLDPVVLTSKAIPWAYPGHPIDASTICVMPERVRDAYTHHQLVTCKGICSDYVGWYKQRHEATTRIGIIIGGRWNCHQENILPQIRTFLKENPTSWLDVHIAVNDSLESRHSYLAEQWMDAPFIASFTCTPFDIPPHYNYHPKKRPETIAKNAVSMHYTNMKAFDQLLASGTAYDAVIKYRPDIIGKRLPNPMNYKERDQSDVILMPHINTFCGANDQVAIGSVAAMREYCNVYPDIDYHLEHEHAYCLHPESMLKFHLDKKNIRTQGFDYCYDLDNRRK